jgi:DNA-binding response OmpR family regulator
VSPARIFRFTRGEDWALTGKLASEHSKASRPSTTTPSILVAEDDDSFADSLASGLASAGYGVRRARTAAETRALLRTARPDLLLLDLGMADADGLTFCRELGVAHPNMPIIIVTGRGSDIDVVQGLDSGAVDYVSKPCSMDVLLARVRSHLRPPRPEDLSVTLKVRDMVVSLAAHSVTWNDQVIELRNREFDLLVYLCRRAGQVITRRELFAEIWDLRWENSSKTLDMHIHALRTKVGMAVEITTIRGVGYRLESP